MAKPIDFEEDIKLECIIHLYTEQLAEVVNENTHDPHTCRRICMSQMQLLEKAGQANEWLVVCALADIASIERLAVLQLASWSVAV